MRNQNLLCSFCTVYFGFASVARIDSILETNVVGTIAFRLDASEHNHESGWYIRTMIGPATSNYIEAWRDWSKLRSGNRVSCHRVCTVVLCNSVAWWYLTSTDLVCFNCHIEIESVWMNDDWGFQLLILELLAVTRDCSQAWQVLKTFLSWKRSFSLSWYMNPSQVQEWAVWAIATELFDV